MASGLIRWPSLFGGGFLLVLVLCYADGPARPRSDLGWHPTRRAVVYDSLRRVGRTIDSLELLSGEARRLLREGRRVGGFGLVAYDYSGALHPIEPSVSGPLDSAWDRLPSHDEAIATLIRINAPSRGVVLPDPSGPDTTVCVNDFWYYEPLHPADFDLALGACGFYAAFGRPGPAVAQWFRSSPMGRSTGSPEWRPPEDSTDWAVVSRRAWAESGWGLRLVRAGMPPAYEASLAVASCAGGAEAGCRDALLHAERPGRRFLYYWWAWSSNDVTGIGSLSRTILPDLVAQFGADRFRAFWRSTDAPSVAFERAFGLPMGTWVEREVRSYYGPVELGAGDLKSASMSALVWTVLLLLLTGVLARRLHY